VNLVAERLDLETVDDAEEGTQLHGNSRRFSYARPPSTHSSEEYQSEEDATSAGGHAPVVGWLDKLTGKSDELVQRLKFPIRIDVTTDPDDGGFIAFAPFLASAGTGKSYAEALQDLSASILNLLEELRSEPTERLAEDALLVKERLTRILG
jgi:predicted RNase H-like HicB family nuclease